MGGSYFPLPSPSPSSSFSFPGQHEVKPSPPSHTITYYTIPRPKQLDQAT